MVAKHALRINEFIFRLSHPNCLTYQSGIALQIDLLLIVPPSGGYEMINTAMYVFSKYLLAYTVTDASAKNTETLVSTKRLKNNKTERPKLAPYLRLKNIQGTTIVKIWKKKFFKKIIFENFFRKKSIF